MGGRINWTLWYMLDKRTTQFIMFGKGIQLQNVVITLHVPDRVHTGYSKVPTIIFILALYMVYLHVFNGNQLMY